MAADMTQDANRHGRRSPQQERPPPTGVKARAQVPAAAPNAALPEHAVFLVPGLLGFESFSTFAYFADRVVAALRAGLEHELHQPVHVFAVPIPPTAALRERQRRLLRTLADRLHALEHEYQPLHVHLVGHSTGGVDAELLTHDQPVAGGAWTDLDSRADSLRSRIRSVVTICSPHQGACLTRDPAARLLQRHDWRGLPAFASVLAKFGVSAMSDVEVADFLFSAKRELGKTYRFVSHLLPRWPLLEDLQPSRVPNRARRQNVLRRSFVTLPGRQKPGSATTPPADAFYRELSARASGWHTGCAEEGELLRASVVRLQQALSSGATDGLVIKAPNIELPSQVDGGHNDGVVNSARQLVDPSDRDELAGIVVGDHFDVVGYYDRRVWRVAEDGHEESTLALSGLLHSGSGFRDAQFFELYRRVAQVIASATR